MCFNGERLLQNVIEEWKNSNYLKAVKYLREAKALSPNEYMLWMFRITSSNFISSSNSSITYSELKQIPFEQLFSIADEEERLPIEKRISSYSTWASISPDTAKKIFEDEIYPKLRNTQYIIQYTYTYCNQVLPRIRNFNRIKAKNIILNANDILNQHIEDKKMLAIYCEPLIVPLVKMEFYEDAFNILDRHKLFIPYANTLMEDLNIKMCLQAEFEDEQYEEFFGKFNKLKEELNLEECGSDICPGCDNSMILYTSKSNPDVNIGFCHHCAKFLE